jgi:hypothetical protein
MFFDFLLILSTPRIYSPAGGILHKKNFEGTTQKKKKKHISPQKKLA